MESLSGFPSSLAGYLQRFAARRRMLLVLRGIGAGAGCWIGWLLAICLIDRAAALPHMVRLVLLAVGVCVSASCAGWIALRGWRGRSWNRVAAAIELRTPVFAERLQTVTSHLLTPQPGRTSFAMLHQTVTSVQELLPRAPVPQLLPWRLAFGPWVGVASLVAVMAGLSWAPGLRVDQLMARALHPNRAIAPVTMTQLVVSPLSAQVSQGGTVMVAARVGGPEALRDVSHPAEVYLSGDRRNWSHASMKLISATTRESEFEFTIPAIDRDLDFYVRGGDARSEMGQIKVQRVPAINEFQIRYDYPEYANHASTLVTNTDGRIECLAGSTATVTILTSEPLRSATWTLDNQPLRMQQAGGPQRWTVVLPVAVNGSCSVELESVDGVAGHGPAPMELHTLRDEPPQPAVIQPASDAQVNAADAIMVSVAATDDYGLAAEEVEIGVNGQVVARAALPTVDRPLRREAELRVQPAALGAGLGDVVTISLRAEDTDGQSTSSEERRILVTTATVPARLEEQVAELRRSRQLAKAWQDALGKAEAALDAARKTPHGAKQESEAWTRGNHAFTTANDAALSLRQSVVRGILRGESSEADGLLASIVDNTMAQVLESGRSLSGSTRGIDVVASRLTGVLANCQEDAEKLTLLQQGLHAQVGLLELENLQGLVGLSTSGRETVAAARASAVDRLRQSLVSWLSDEGLTLSPQIQSQLQQRVEAARAAEAKSATQDPLAQARDWAAHLGKQSGGSISEFPSRLAMGALMEAVRPAGDPRRSRDLLLVARAAGALAQLSPTAREGERTGQRNKSPGPVAQFQSAVQQLAKDDRLPTSAENRAAAEEARAHLIELAAGSAETANAADMFDPAITWAIDAAADIGQQNYAAAEQADDRLVREVARTSPMQAAQLEQQAAHSLSLVRLIDQLLGQQSDVQQLLEQSSFVDASAEQNEITEAMRRLRIGTVVPTPSAAPTTQISAQAENPGAAFTVPQPPPEVAQRHPWLAAVWQGQAATELLAATQVKPATEHMQQVIHFLEQTRIHAVHRAALLRLAQAPSLNWLFEPDSESDVGPMVAAAGPTTGALAAPDWRHFSAPGDSPYREELKIYFDSLAKEEREKK